MNPIGRAVGALRQNPRRLWLVVFLLTTALGSVWALAVPRYAGPDERDHVLRAVSLVRGEMFGEELPTGGLNVDAPGVYSSDNTACFATNLLVSAACQHFDNAAPDMAQRSTAGRYPPVYYVVTGIPSLPLPNAAGIYLMRIAGAAMCAALLASAVLTIESSEDRKLGHLGLAVALTPMTLFLLGIVNPSELEVFAAIGVWVSGHALLTRSDGGVDRRILARFGIAAILLAQARTIGPLWLAIAVGALAVLSSWSSVKAIAKDKVAWIWAAAVGVAVFVQLLWIKYAAPFSGAPLDNPPAGTFTDLFRYLIGVSWTAHQLQMIGVFGWLDTLAPQSTYVIWTMAVGVLLLIGLAWAPRRALLSIIGVLVLLLVLPSVIDAAQAKEHGIIWQGRYTLPIGVGLPLLCALAVRGRARLALRGTRLFAALGVLLFIAQMGALWQTLRRFSAGSEGPLAFWSSATWSPAVPSLVLLVGYGLAYAVLLGVLFGGRDLPASRGGPALAGADPADVDARTDGGDPAVGAAATEPDADGRDAVLAGGA